MREGLTASIVAFLIWGVLPLYLRVVSAVPPLEIMAHRLLWSVVVVYAYLLATKRMGAPLAALRNPRTRRGLIATSLLISANWLTFMYAVSIHRTVDASLGYFVNPLLNVVLGVIVLRERLRPLQWLAVGVATCGVLWLAWSGGEIPWISLIVAVSFASYGLIRKVIAVEAVAGLAAETTLLAPFALGYVLLRHTADASTIGWLMLGGPITAVPLALFAYGARLIPLATLGLIQYLAPSMQFLIGVLVFGENFAGARAVGFAIIWLALVLYAGEGLLRSLFSRPRSDPGPETAPR